MAPRLEGTGSQRTVKKKLEAFFQNDLQWTIIYVYIDAHRPMERQNKTWTDSAKSDQPDGTDRNFLEISCQIHALLDPYTTGNTPRTSPPPRGRAF